MIIITSHRRAVRMPGLLALLKREFEAHRMKEQLVHVQVAGAMRAGADRLPCGVLNRQQLCERDAEAIEGNVVAAGRNMRDGVVVILIASLRQHSVNLESQFFAVDSSQLREESDEQFRAVGVADTASVMPSGPVAF